ncbi:unnamed protein product [Gongylonema pulchrum]|uniref:Uncharacterized protein n=1 Tax=Gongylonema pulchrum TaxID=637853 RepID=A0A183DB70_9BILA|nr:unnamed protein product [Gongylonema pulchrum]
MLLHRFGTMAHIIASTELFCCRKRVGHLTEDELVVQNAVEIARELQAIRGVDENAPPEEQAISRRNIVRHLESSKRSMYRPKTETLDAAFRKRFFALSSIQPVDRSSSERRLTLRRNTIRAIERRRNSIFGAQQQTSDVSLFPEGWRTATSRARSHLNRSTCSSWQPEFAAIQLAATMRA